MTSTPRLVTNFRRPILALACLLLPCSFSPAQVAPAPAVDAAGLTYEPALFITDATGTVVERLDAVWNEEELLEVLDSIPPS